MREALWIRMLGPKDPELSVDGWFVYVMGRALACCAFILSPESSYKTKSMAISLQLCNPLHACVHPALLSSILLIYLIQSHQEINQRMVSDFFIKLM